MSYTPVSRLENVVRFHAQEWKPLSEKIGVTTLEVGDAILAEPVLATDKKSISYTIQTDKGERRLECLRKVDIEFCHSEVWRKA